MSEGDAPSPRAAGARCGAVDLLKALAIFGVLIIHITVEGLKTPLGSFDWCSALFWGSIARASVPIFLMCSGALLLMPERELTLRKLWLHNIPRILAAMLFWGMVYKVYDILSTGGALTGAALWQGFKEVLLFKQVFHFYYIQIILLVYAFLPATRLFVRHASQRELLYFLALWFLLGITLPILLPLWPFKLMGGLTSYWAMNMSYCSIGYAVLGYYLRRYPLRSAAGSAGLFLLGFAATFGMMVWRSLVLGATQLTYWNAMTPFVAVMAIGLFGFVVARMGERPAPPLIAHISKGAFCFYLVHVLLLWLLRSVGLHDSILPNLLSIPLITAAVYLCCEAVYIPLSHIPGVRRWLI